ncbi:ThiF family adenylyltransferase [Paenibacillus thailandensis]|uniref:ThiF family adenylyltransferase n=1 Tax=Paenibacillus thailandensis TaxID=393250 RepID=A0ABW5QS42_9BACL
MNEPELKTTSLPPADQRYARQIRYSGIGKDGQAAIMGSRAAVAGVGALGTVIAQHLVRSGVGFVRVIDRDIVDWSNLQRQVLYDESDARAVLPKAEAAAARLRSINGSVAVEAVMADITAANAESLLGDVDVILDGTDNFSVRYLINDVSVKHGIPWIYGGAVGGAGVTMTIRPGISPCYRCLFPEPPPAGSADTCETAGILSPVSDIIGSWQALEALKLLAGREEALHGKLMQVDAWNGSLMPLGIAGSRRSDCPACGLRRFDYLDNVSELPASAALCGRNTIQISPGSPVELALPELAARLRAVYPVETSPYLIRIAVSDELTLVLFPDGRALVQGTDNPVKARAIYAEILGF